ncbi:MAG: D-alanine--D-alanine ligase [Clostridiales bacterium]|nr:D-alanine--D-alanine ligase [Clostridiales bacterium]
MNKKQTLGVFFGSRSCEHDISIITGLQLIQAINREKYYVVPVYIDQKGKWYTGEGLLNIKLYTDFSQEKEGMIPISLDLTSGSGALISYEKSKGIFGKLEQKIIARIDCAVLTFHGLHGEDGSVQGIMEMANIPYTSSGIPGCAIAMDKILLKQYLQGANFPVVPGTWFYRSTWEKRNQYVIDEIEKIEYPVVVKPANLGSSIGVSLVKNQEQLTEALEIAFAFDRKVLVEKAIMNMIELNCSVLGYEEEVYASELEKPETNENAIYSHEDKYATNRNKSTSGMASAKRVIPAPISEELKERIQKMSKEIFALLDLKGVVRIDYMLDQHSDTLYVTEVNTIPGSMSFYLWDHTNIPYGKLIDKLVDIALLAFEQKQASNYAYESDILQGVELSSGKIGAKGTKLSSFSK